MSELSTTIKRACVVALMGLQASLPIGGTWVQATATAGLIAAVAVPRNAQAMASGSIVFDPTNLAESVKQTAEWGVQHANTLRSYITQLSQLKAAFDQILALKDMAIKDLLAGLGIGDIMDAISSVQGALNDVRNLNSDIQSLRTSFSDIGKFWNTGTFNFTQFAYQQMQSALRSGNFATSEFERRRRLLEQTSRNLDRVNRSQNMIGAKSQQSALDNLNAQTQMVATGIHTLLSEVVQENLYLSAERKAKADADVNAQTFQDWANNLSTWRAGLIGTNIVK